MTRLRRLLLALLLLLFIGAGLSVPYRSWRTREHLRAARQALADRRLDTARERLLAYLEDEPNSAEARLLLARVLRLTNHPDEAEVQLDVCELLGTIPEEVLLERGLGAVQQGDLALEKVLWRHVEAGHADAAVMLEALARGYRKNYLLGPMRSALNAWLERQPGCVEALLLHGWVHEQHKDYEHAGEDYRQAVAADPNHKEARLRGARVLLLQGKPAEAVATFRELYEQTAEAPAGLGLARCWRQLGRAGEARRLLEELAARHPADFSLLLELGQLLLETGDAAGAEAWLRRALRSSPHDYQAHYALADSLRRQGKHEEETRVRARAKEIGADLARMAELMDQLQKRPGDANLRCEIGKLLLRSGEEREGILWLRSALRADPAHEPSRRALAARHAGPES